MKERDSRCSWEISIPCRCTPASPKVGTPEYGLHRTHPDADDLEALRLVTSWLSDGAPLAHLRYSDGEFWTILGRQGVNTDGLRMNAGPFGQELAHILRSVSTGGWGSRVLVGSDWTIPEHEAYVRSAGLLESVPWCPSSIWVNGVLSGLLAEFF